MIIAINTECAKMNPMLMSRIITRIQFSFILLMLTTIVFSQKRDSTVHTYYQVADKALLNIDFQHTSLNIATSENDSIMIYTHIRIIPTNPSTPFAGITLETKQDDNKNVSAFIAVDEKVQPHNEFESHCKIAVPKGTKIKLRSRYGIIDINGLEGQLDAHISYSNLSVDTLSSLHTHHLEGKYSSIIIDHSDNNVSFKGENTNFTANYIKRLEADSKYSMFSVETVGSLILESYTDKFIIGEVDSIQINSTKSLCITEHLHVFFQGEMDGGSLMLNKVNKDYNTINIANNKVTSHLGFSPQSTFSINADMRYCQLNHEALKVQEIKAPNSTLYSGYYGTSDKIESNLSIISAYGDVNIHFE